MSTLPGRIRLEAELTSRRGQYADLMQIALEVEALEDEAAALRREVAEASKSH